MDDILDVDLLRFENGSPQQRAAVVDGVMRSLGSAGFVYTSHDMPSGLLDNTYWMLDAFFRQPEKIKQQNTDEGSFGSRGYTGLLVEKAAVAEKPDWKEMLNWSSDLPPNHPFRT